MTPCPDPTWPPPPNYLPTKLADAATPYSAAVCPNSVAPVTVTLAAAPSGTGELTIASLTVARNVATFEASGGVPGRVYTLKFQTTDAGGDTYETLVFLPLSYEFGVDPPPVPPSAGFGSTLTWSA